jgi:hypothetical protein
VEVSSVSLHLRAGRVGGEHLDLGLPLRRLLRHHGIPAIKVVLYNFLTDLGSKVELLRQVKLVVYVLAHGKKEHDWTIIKKHYRVRHGGICL